ncbi:aspartate/glutamate racemase family protein [Roseisalinus antarcticus]|uniref:Asp/Glu/Hydantoin racemase n=1 Tax=Roseisalinus antarcticus TaxID=254357 RepID=A0A1Y5TEG7_9RHOB|nr:aspartate/glutamate racemase family protein [Roseisalinus antarcticus]SLN61896.1 Asp/Glu/Hydantoin racemase [Roseisalinus antarcticus]
MRIVFMNPNSSSSMTESIDATAQDVFPEAEIVGWTNTTGPATIEGPVDGDAVVPWLTDMVPTAADWGAQAMIVACFDDTGLAEVRARAQCPVLGIGQASYHFAALQGTCFAVLTSVDVAIPVLEGNIRQNGFAEVSLPVMACGLSPQVLEDGSDATLARVRTRIDDLEAAGADSIILGCAGTSRHREILQRTTKVRLIDGVRAATWLAGALIAERTFQAS